MVNKTAKPKSLKSNKKCFQNPKTSLSAISSFCWPRSAECSVRVWWFCWRNLKRARHTCCIWGSADSIINITWLKDLKPSKTRPIHPSRLSSDQQAPRTICLFGATSSLLYDLIPRLQTCGGRRMQVTNKQRSVGGKPSSVSGDSHGKTNLRRSIWWTSWWF